VNIFFRVDASVEIGSGHVHRCITLANELKGIAGNSTFICRGYIGNLVPLIKKNGHEVILVQSKGDMFPENRKYNWNNAEIKDDLDSTLEAIGCTGLVDLFIVDHYGIDERWCGKIRPYCKNMLVVDDLANRNFDCDFLLDQTLNRKKKDYRNLVPPGCELMLGSEYALLRPEFLQHRQAAKKRRNDISQPRNLLISLGGTDPDFLTELAMLALSESDSASKFLVDIVLSSQAPHLDRVVKLSKNMPYKTNLHIDSSEMAYLMTNADMAIGAGGTTSWERCCLGLPTLAIVMTDNQKGVIGALESAGATVNVGHGKDIDSHKLSAFIDRYVNDPRSLHDMSKKSFETCDGLGAKRCVSTLLN